MKILHVLGKLDRGGVETWLVQILRNIDRSKYQMDFVVHTTMPGAYDDEVRALGSKIIPCLKPSSPIRYARNFRRILREHGPYDVVHSHVHHYSGYVLALAAVFGVRRRIAQSHNDTRGISSRATLVRKVYCMLMEGMISSCSTMCLAVSRDAAAALSRTSSAAVWRQIPLGIDLCKFEGEVDKAKIRRNLGIPETGTVIGHVGRFDPQKNHTFLVDIAKMFLQLEPAATFLLVGDGPLRSAIQQRVGDANIADHFIFAGVRRDVALLMRGGMDVFCFPSLYEGLGIVLLEAQAAGLPIVMSDAVPDEAVVNPGLISRCALEASPQTWCEAIQALVRHPRPDPAEALAKMQDWSVESSAQKLLDYYELQ